MQTEKESRGKKGERGKGKHKCLWKKKIKYCSERKKRKRGEKRKGGVREKRRKEGEEKKKELFSTNFFFFFSLSWSISISSIAMPP